MPYSMSHQHGGWVVVNQATGQKKNDKPLPKARATALMQALYANVPDASHKEGKPNYGAEAGQTISGNLVRGPDGKFAAADKVKTMPTRQRHKIEQEALRANQQEDLKRDAEQQGKNFDDTVTKVIPEDLQEAFTFLDQDPTTKFNPEYEDKMIKAGLLRRDAIGNTQPTPEAKKIMQAGKAGDADTAGKYVALAQQNADKRAAAASRRAAAEAKRQRKAGVGLPGNPPTRVAGASPEKTLGKEAYYGPKLRETYLKRTYKSLPTTPRNLLEGKVHQAFTCAADEIFMRGYITREERIQLSGLIGDLLGAFGQAIESTLMSCNMLPVSPDDVSYIASKSKLVVLKGANGQYRWIAISSSAFKDRDGQYVTQVALKEDCDYCDMTQDYGPLRVWHVPGWDIGTCDFNMVHGRLLIESGTFKNEAFALALKEAIEAGEDIGMSIAFRHSVFAPDAEGAFWRIRRFERSILPGSSASNLLTRFAIAA